MSRRSSRACTLPEPACGDSRSATSAVTTATSRHLAAGPTLRVEAVPSPAPAVAVAVPAGPLAPPPDGDCPQTGGSTIGCETQSLSEELPIPGTPYTLYYNSFTQLGRADAWTLAIPVVASTLPASLAYAQIDIEVGGQTISRRFNNPSFALEPNTTYYGTLQPNLTTTYTWNGEDKFGRVLQGAQPIAVNYYFYYPGYYTASPNGVPAAFGLTGSGATISTGNSRENLYQHSLWAGSIGRFHADGLGLGGWTLSANHFYDADVSAVYYGDGTRRTTAGLPAISRTVATLSNNGGAIAVGPDGTVYWADGAQVKSLVPNGTVSVAAGTGGYGTTGNEGPAILAQTSDITALAVGSDGSLYIQAVAIVTGSTAGNIVRKVTPDGIIHAFAFDGNRPQAANDTFGDYGPALSAECEPGSALAVGPDGSVYVGCSSTVRKIAPGGTIRRPRRLGNRPAWP